MPACRAGRRTQACAAKASAAKVRPLASRFFWQPFARPLLTPLRVQRATAAVQSAEPAGATRRQLLALVGSVAVVLRAKPALAKVPAGFNALKDTTKGYAFIYPVGWQARLDGAASTAAPQPVTPAHCSPDAPRRKLCRTARTRRSRT